MALKGIYSMRLAQTLKAFAQAIDPLPREDRRVFSQNDATALLADRVVLMMDSHRVLSDMQNAVNDFRSAHRVRQSKKADDRFARPRQ